MSANAEAIVAENAMHADLTIIERSGMDVGQWAFEAALFKSGRPVLLMPPSWRGTQSARISSLRGAKREAVRALADAAPFLSEAEHVTVLTVDALPDGYGEGPGRDISTHLARHGLKVELRNVDGLGRSVERRCSMKRARLRPISWLWAAMAIRAFGSLCSAA